MFQVTSLDLKNPPLTDKGDIDYKKDFFGKETHLTVSGQLNGEAMAMSLGDIYTFGPTFRAENLIQLGIWLILDGRARDISQLKRLQILQRIF